MQTLFHLVLFGDQGVVSRERTKQALKTGLTGESLREGQDYCKLSPVLFALGFLILLPGSLRMFQNRLYSGVVGVKGRRNSI